MPQYGESGGEDLIAAVTGEGKHIGHCIVSQWVHEEFRVWWITQLVVHTQYRNQKKATRVEELFP
jgi:hypothetical protein